MLLDIQIVAVQKLQAHLQHANEIRRAASHPLDGMAQLHLVKALRPLTCTFRVFWVDDIIGYVALSYEWAIYEHLAVYLAEEDVIRVRRSIHP